MSFSAIEVYEVLSGNIVDLVTSCRNNIDEGGGRKTELISGLIKDTKWKLQKTYVY